ncbi:hypothetical protein [Aquimarina longa]|uniref:hypothetical protein n=1 Tax=Aquimarina longa TaxID=1080221 RepID=UPI0007856BB4|nr:hypothetical protein [Aquimarina longa]
MKAKLKINCTFLLILLIVSCKPCKNIIPNHETLKLPEGLGVYYPGQTILNSQPGEPLDSIKEIEISNRKEPGGTLNVTSKKKISNSLEGSLKEIFKADVDRGKIQSISVELNNMYKILGKKDEVYGSANDVIVIKNVLLSDVEIKLEVKDTTSLKIDVVEEKIEGKLKAKLEKSGDNKFDFTASDLVVGVQTDYVKNVSEQEYQSTDKFILNNNYNRVLSIIPVSKNFKRPTEITFNFPEVEEAHTESNKRDVQINIFGTGAVIKINKTLELNNLQPFSHIVPGTGKKSKDKLIVYTFDFVRLSKSEMNNLKESDNGMPMKINVNRSMKKIKEIESGLIILCE